MGLINGTQGVGYNETLIGTAADDTIDGKGGGDRIDGGAGTDTAVFFDSKNYFSVMTLAGITHVRALTGGDRQYYSSSYPYDAVLTNVETVQFVDDTISIAPSSTTSFIFGSVGVSSSDTLNGTTGNDTFDGRGGSDRIDGGAGTDTAVFFDNSTNFRISNVSGVTHITALAGADRQYYSSSYPYDALLTNVEVIQFLDQSIWIGPADAIAPTVTQYSPEDDSTGAAIGNNITFTFTESIQRGTGNITLKTVAGAAVETFDAATSTCLSISGASLTIDPTSTLTNGTGYYVTFEAGTVKDSADNSYAGTTSYNFTTAAIAGQNLIGTAGDDTFNGGTGIDTVVLSGLPSQYRLSGNTLVGIEGTDTVASIEQYRFGSSLGSVSNVSANDLNDPDGAGPRVPQAIHDLQGISDLYVAYFNRAPDVGGMMYWFGELRNGSSWTLSTIAQSFTDQTEYKETYPAGLSNRDFIEKIYLNLFDRAPDAGGWDYWENDLNHGVARDVFIYTVIQGAYAPTGGAQDKALLNNKHDVSLYYSEQLATSAEVFDNKIDQVLNRVTANTHSVVDAKAVIDYVIDNPISLTGVINDTATWEAFWV